MTQALVDTSAYPAFVRGHQGIVRAVSASDRLVVSPSVLGELRAGFASGTRREADESKLRSFLDSPRAEVVPVVEATSAFYAAIYASMG